MMRDSFVIYNPLWFSRQYPRDRGIVEISSVGPQFPVIGPGLGLQHACNVLDVSPLSHLDELELTRGEEAGESNRGEPGVEVEWRRMRNIHRRDVGVDACTGHQTLSHVLEAQVWIVYVLQGLVQHHEVVRQLGDSQRLQIMVLWVVGIVEIRYLRKRKVV